MDTIATIISLTFGALGAGVLFIRLVVKAELGKVRTELREDHTSLWEKLDAVQTKVDELAGEFRGYLKREKPS